MNLLSKIEYTSVSELEYNHLPLEKLPFRRLTFSVHNVNFVKLTFFATFTLDVDRTGRCAEPKMFRIASGQF
jgi:hypothetical protein